MSALLLGIAFAGISMAQTHNDGLEAMQLENWDEAITIYTALTKKAPTDQPAWLAMGSAYLANGNKEKALETFDAAFKANSDGVYAMIATARILLLKNDQAEADKVMKKAEKLARKDVLAKRLIGESYLYDVPGTKPNFTRAEEKLKEAMDYDSKDYPTLMSLAYCYKEMPNGGLAAQHYEYAVNVQPSDPFPVYMLAKVYRTAKIYDKFLNYIDKAISLDPKFSDALRAKAEFLYFDRKWEDATDAAKALVNNARDVTIEDMMLLANLLYITKDCAGCSQLVDRILKMDGSKNYLRRLQAYCHYDNGKYEEGLNILNDFFKQVTPDKVRSSDYEYLGKLQIEAGKDTVAAIGNFKKAMELDSSRWPLHDEIGNLLYNKRDFCGAAVAYQTNLDSVETPSAVQYYRLGLCHYFCTDDSLHFEKAEQSFGRVTEIAPEAGIGWSWRAKAMSKLEPDIENNPELLDEFGKAKPFFEKFIEIGETDPQKNKRDLVTSYEYMSSYFFLKNDDENARMYLTKLFELEPENQTGKDIQQFLDGETPAPPMNNGSGGKK